jgi:hypothetical protein
MIATEDTADVSGLRLFEDDTAQRLGWYVLLLREGPGNWQHSV